MKKLLLIVALLAPLPLAAADTLGGAASYLRSGAGAQALGMGGAAVALVDDVTATVWNPAGLTRLGVHATQFGAMTSVLTQDRSLNYLGFAQHTESYGDFGLALHQFGVERIEGFDNQGQSTGFFNDQELALGLSYANKVSYQVRYGFTVRGFYQDLAATKAMGYGCDLGALYQPSLASEFTVGMNLQNPISVLTWESGRQDVVASVLKLGLGDRHLNGRLGIAGDLDVPLGGEGAMATHVGAELWLLEGLAVRGGLNRKDLTMGATWRMEFYQVDYAFVLGQAQFGDSHQVSLMLKF